MKGLSQEALDRASFELQRHFGREGSIYGIKACEEIAKIALTAYGTVPEVGEMFEQLAQMCDEIGSKEYPKKDPTHGERLAWCHGAVACADAIRDRARSNMNSCKG